MPMASCAVWHLVDAQDTLAAQFERFLTCTHMGAFKKDIFPFKSGSLFFCFLNQRSPFQLIFSVLQSVSVC